MARSIKTKEGQRNYRCLNYSKCLAEAAISNSSFSCSSCEKDMSRSFNDLLRYESMGGISDVELKPRQVANA